MRTLGLKMWRLIAGRTEYDRFWLSLRRAESFSKRDLESVQDELLGRLLRHAYEKVPYYGRVLREKGGDSLFRAASPRTILRAMPILTKDILRVEFDNLKSSDISSRRWFTNFSGGSTGEPVRFIQDLAHSLRLDAVKSLYDAWTGYREGMRRVRLWGSERDLLVGKETLRTRMSRWLRNELYLNSFRMTESDMDSYVAELNRFRPVQILGYVDAMYELACYIERKGLEVFSPKSIMTSAGTLYPHMRETIERVFCTRVFNRYGSREVGDIACECEAHDGLHISPLTHYVEILREDGSPAAPGEEGEVVVTALQNFAMPLIRYRIGDRAVWAETQTCECGRKWPKLQRVTGRVTDVFVLRDGTRVSPAYFIHMIGVVLRPEWVRKFQVVQEDFDFVRLLIVPTDKERVGRGTGMEIEHTELARIVGLVLGGECRLEIEYVDDIPPTPSGKYRYVVSRVAEERIGQ